METRINYTVVGAFVVVLATALIAGIIWLSAGLVTQQYNDYVAYVTESVSGLNVNAPVKYRGVDVGFVREISLRPGSPEEVRILMSIEEGTPVKEDTVAILSVQGLTGIAFIDLTEGSVEAPMLTAREGELYPEIKTGPSLLARLEEASSRMFTNIERVADSFHALVNEEVQEDFQASLDQINSFTARLNDLLNDRNTRRVEETVAGLHRLATTLEGHSEDLSRTIDNLAVASESMPGAIDRLDRSARSLERMGNSLHQAGEEFTVTLQETRGEVRHFSQQVAPEIVTILAEIRELSGSLEQFIHELERDPAMLVHGRRALRRGPGE